MWIRSVRAILTTFTWLSLAVCSRTALPAQPKPPAPASALVDDLPRLVSEAKEQFREPSAEVLAEAKARVEKGLGDLRVVLARQPDGESTGAQFKLDVLAEQLAATEPDIAALAEVLAALQNNQPNSLASAYYHLRSALRIYLRMSRASREPGIRDEYAKQLDQLAEAWRQFAATGEQAPEDQVRASYTWFKVHGQDFELLDRIAAEHSRPNQRLRISARFIDTALDRPINQPLSNDSNSKGVNVRVRGKIAGSVKATLMPDPDAASMAVHFKGLGTSKITARKGKATICANGRTCVDVVESVHISDEGIATGGDPSIRVRNNIQPYSANLRVRSRVLRRLANPLILKIVKGQRGKINGDANRSVQKQLREQLSEGAATLEKETKKFMVQFSVPVSLEAEIAATHYASTSTTHIQWLALYGSSWQLGSLAPPPVSPAANPGVQVQVHESAINNSAGPLAGLEIAEPDFREIAFETIGLIPSGDDEIGARIPAVITLADENPLEIRFRDQRVHSKMRIKSFENDGMRYEGQVWTVHAAYAVQMEPRLALVRDPVIDVEPADAPHVEELRKTMHYLYVERAVQGGPSLKDIGNAPNLQVADLSLTHGWLSLALNILPTLRSDRTARRD